MARFNFLHDMSIMLLLGIKQSVDKLRRMIHEKMMEHCQDPIESTEVNVRQVPYIIYLIVGYIGSLLP